MFQFLFYNASSDEFMQANERVNVNMNIPLKSNSKYNRYIHMKHDRKRQVCIGDK